MLRMPIQHQHSHERQFMPSRFIRVEAANSVTLRHITMRQSIIGRIVCGQKILPLPAHHEIIGSGELFCFERRSSWQIVQQADRGRVYAAELLLLDQADIDTCGLFRPSENTGRPAASFVYHRQPDAAWQAAWQRLSTTAEPPAADIHTLLHLLDAAGWRFSGGGRLSTTEQLERLLAARLHLPWTQTQAAAELGISDSTLKRRLRAGQTSFACLLRQLRMETALFLLMSSTRPIGEIAAACGYQSGGHFAAAFKQQFGFLPSRLRA